MKTMSTIQRDITTCYNLIYMIAYPEERTYRTQNATEKTLLIWFQLSLAFTCGESINTSNNLRLKSALVFSSYC